MMRPVLLAMLAVLLFPGRAGGAEGQPKTLPLPGEVFAVRGRPAFLIPGTAAAGQAKPWVWYAPTLPGLPSNDERWMFERFQAGGIAVAGVDAGESYGSPAGNEVFTAFHQALTGRGYSARPVLLGRSRGGLMALSWAAEHPGQVAGFAGIYPVVDLASYPGIARAAPAFGMIPEELNAELARFNPIDRLAPLARAGVPLFAIHGDSDKLVPLEANSGAMTGRYRALGGPVELIVPAGQGHNMWIGFFQCAELVRFVEEHAGPRLMVTAPLNYQVFQRASEKQGVIRIAGRFAGARGKRCVIEARVTAGGIEGPWRRVRSGPGGEFDGTVKAPAGGWHRIGVRARAGKEILAEAVVGQVGVGEVFVVAGQSNSANHGAEKQRTRTGQVSAFDGQRWQPANDPQPGASGGGGSFLPPFGDALAERFGVPVGLVACGVGATSVREWLPHGTRFPHPPTLTGNVEQLPDGFWISEGEHYDRFIARLRPLGRHGFRAILWHQGESDANQADPRRTLPGPLYRAQLETLIRASRRALGWSAPWFVAQATYHGPGDERSDDIRAAQASLWDDGIAWRGPDTDTLKAESRDNGGKGVHFSGPGLRRHAMLWVEAVAPWLELRLR